MTSPASSSDALSAEDAKLVVLARATKARTNAAEGAALRDLDGRTYAAATLALPSLEVSALVGCLAMAASSGAQGIEAAVVLGTGGIAEADRIALAEFAGAGVPIHAGSASGAITATLRS